MLIIILSNVKRNLVEDKKIKFWRDIWLDFKPLWDLFLQTHVLSTKKERLWQILWGNYDIGADGEFFLVVCQPG